MGLPSKPPAQGSLPSARLCQPPQPSLSGLSKASESPTVSRGVAVFLAGAPAPPSGGPRLCPAAVARVAGLLLLLLLRSLPPPVVASIVVVFLPPLVPVLPGRRLRDSVSRVLPLVPHCSEDQLCPTLFLRSSSSSSSCLCPTCQAVCLPLVRASPGT